MGETSGSCGSNSNKQKHTLLTGRALQSCREHVQPQNGINTLWQFDNFS